MKKKLSHVDASGLPAMVDVSAKNVTHRVAQATARVWLPPAVAELLTDGELMTKKGPVFQTAILAGVMAAKHTHHLIPLCHALQLEDCQVSITAEGDWAVILTTVRVTAKTGAEMEALTAASVAALTIYDMCKSRAHNIVIGEIKLVSKSGGKSDFKG